MVHGNAVLLSLCSNLKGLIRQILSDQLGKITCVLAHSRFGAKAFDILKDRKRNAVGQADIIVFFLCKYAMQRLRQADQIA